jgi:hypothetical protein
MSRRDQQTYVRESDMPEGALSDQQQSFFQAGYHQGRRDRGRRNSAVLFSSLLTFLIGSGALAWYLLSRSNLSPTTPSIVLPSPAAPPSQMSPPDVNITIPPVPAPQIDINLPEPSMQTTPQSESTPPMSPASPEVPTSSSMP